MAEDSMRARDGREEEVLWKYRRRVVVGGLSPEKKFLSISRSKGLNMKGCIGNVPICCLNQLHILRVLQEASAKSGYYLWRINV
ncbi:unnamed protein product [Arabis nemorensis]|uniref:Uncharacterized protein n=1 Tax=Arabis nemorensis TaxID=586526 RepID=A0A565CN54_9BRAS|nr:unnamed protein product [Arabis nemorensis]